MWEEASVISLFGKDVYLWGLLCALGSLCFLLVLLFTEHNTKLIKGTWCLTGLLSLVLGVVLSRVFYCLLDRSLGTRIPFHAWFRLDGGGFSMFGALAGVVLAAFLSAAFTKQSFAAVADVSLPAFLAFVAFERVGEHWIPDFGISRQLEAEWMANSFLAVKGDYGVSYLATYFLEAVAAIILLVILLVSLKKSTRDGNTALLFLLLFGAVQTLLESLRYDYHISISFVGLQQILSFVLIAIATIILARRNMKTQKRLSILSLILLPVIIGLCVLLEFGLDRTAINKFLLYGVFILLLCVPVTLALRLRKEDKA